jgi:hypothetical protein
VVLGKAEHPMGGQEEQLQGIALCRSP